MSELKRRHFLLGAAGLGTAAGLSACAGSGGGGGNNGGGGDNGDGEVESLTFWSNHPGSSKEVEEELIAGFEEETGIQVSLNTAGSSYEEVAQRFNAALSGGELPDVLVASDVTWFNFALTGAITPMDELWTAVGVDSDAYVDSLREDYVHNGGHYALPYCRSTPLFYYNKELWEAAGLPDRSPETWQEFAEFAEELAAAGGEVPMVTPDGAGYVDWQFQGMIWTFGGAYSRDWEMTFTEDASLEAGQFLQDEVAAGHIELNNDPINVFGSGQAASMLQSTGSLRGLNEVAEFEFGTGFLPGPPPACPTGGAGMAIPDGISDARKEAAMQFIEYMTNTENTISFSQQVGYMPVRKDAVEHPDTQAYLDENPNFRTALEQLEVTQSQDNARVLLPGGGDRIGGGLDRIATGGQDVEQVFTELAEESQEVFERDIEPLL